MKDRAKVALANCVCASENNDTKKGKLTTYCQVVRYQLAFYATEDVTVEAGVTIRNFKQLEHIAAVRYSELLWE